MVTLNLRAWNDHNGIPSVQPRTACLIDQLRSMMKEPSAKALVRVEVIRER
jgi:hypothetical protein